MTAKRGNAYYLKRLEEEFPAEFEKFQRGLYETPAEAFRATGLKKPRSRFLELKNAWSKATTAEQREFLRHAGLVPAKSASAASPSLPFATGNYLNEWVKERIQEIMLKRGMKSGDVMRELGLRPSNPSLGLALHRGNSLQSDVIAKLEEWMKANEKI